MEPDISKMYNMVMRICELPSEDAMYIDTLMYNPTPNDPYFSGDISLRERIKCIKIAIECIQSFGSEAERVTEAALAYMRGADELAEEWLLGEHGSTVHTTEDQLTRLITRLTNHLNQFG